MTTPSLPPPYIAAVAIGGLLTLMHDLPPEDFQKLTDTPEPYRCAAYMLGWGLADGTEWWVQVMDCMERKVCLRSY